MISKKLVIIFLGIFIIPSYAFALEGTFYADSFEGGGTSDGSKFSQSIFSAAACNVELGQYGYVRYGNTGAVVTVNDRPNCRKYPDIIDLSRSAFEVFAPTSIGRIYDVGLTLLGKNVNNFPKQNLAFDTFANLGVRLTNTVSNTYFTEDSILINGKVTIKKEYALIYLEEKSTGKKVFTELAKTDKNGNFSYLLHFPENPGEYYFIIAGGNSFETTTPSLIKLIKKGDFLYPDISSTRYTFRPTVSAGETPSMNLPTGLWASLSIIRDGRTFSTQGVGALSFEGINFTSGKAQIKMEGYTISTPSSLDRSQYIPNLFSGSVILDRIHENIGREKISLRTTKQIASFRFRLKAGESVRSTYYVTLPNGDVREYEMAKQFVETNGLLKTGIWITGNFPISEEGAYKFELVQSNGFAYVNLPIYRGNVWSILPVMTNNEKTTIRTNRELVINDTLTAINKLRASLGRNLIVIDSTLAQVAQAKAEDMMTTDVTHENSKGKDIRNLIKSLGLQVTTTLYENVAGGSGSDIVLQDGLEESGSHRSAMIEPKVTKVGIGYAVKDGRTYMAQVFGE